MTQSPEYPDLQFAPPRGWGGGRDGKAVRYLVVHYTAGAERSTSAEDGAVYDRRRTDGVSTHYFADSNSVVQCVQTRDRANAAFRKGNRLGIQYELCGTVQTRAQWLDGPSDATLTNAARQMAADCRRYGIPVRKLTPAEVRAAWYQFPNGPKGICGHADVTLAYPEDGGNHTDPGQGFPWDVLLERIQRHIEPPTESTTEDDDMLFLAQVTGRPDVWKGNGLSAVGVNSPDAVRDLLAVGASGRWLSGFYAGGKGQPFASVKEMEDRIGRIVLDEPVRPAGA